MPQAAYFLPIVFGIAHGLLFGILLGVRAVRMRALADAFLTALILAGCLRMLPYVLGFLDINVLWNEWLFLPLDTGLAIGPLFWYYLLARTNNTMRLRARDLLHAVPFAVYAAYRVAVFSQDSTFVFEWVDRVDLPVIQPAVNLLTSASLALYLALAIRLLLQYRGWLDDEFSDVDRIRLTWLSSFTFAVSAAVVTFWVFGLLEWMGRDLDALQAWWPFAVNTATLYYLSLAGYMHPQSERVAFIARATRPMRPELLDADQAALARRLEQAMTGDELYLRPELSLEAVATQLSSPRGLVSQVINEAFGVNFRTFINAYRVEAVRHQLDSESNLTLVGIALDHGFNSKATFNRVFKQMTGLTPRQYAALSDGERRLHPSVIPSVSPAVSWANRRESNLTS